MVFPTLPVFRQGNRITHQKYQQLSEDSQLVNQEAGPLIRQAGSRGCTPIPVPNCLLPRSELDTFHFSPIFQSDPSATPTIPSSQPNLFGGHSSVPPFWYCLFWSLSRTKYKSQSLLTDINALPPISHYTPHSKPHPPPCFLALF